MVNAFTPSDGTGGSSGSGSGDEETSSRDIDEEVTRASRNESLVSRSGDTSGAAPTTRREAMASSGDGQQSTTEQSSGSPPSGESSSTTAEVTEVDTGGLTRRGTAVESVMRVPEDTGGLTRRGQAVETAASEDNRSPGGSSRGTGRRSSAFDAETTDGDGEEAIEQSRVESFVDDFESTTGVGVPGEGPIATEKQTFREIDFSFGLGGEGDEVEQATVDLQTGTQETFEPVAEELFGKPDKVLGGFEYSSGVAIALNKAGRPVLAEQVDTTIRNMGKGIVVGTPTALAGLPKTALELTEIGAEAIVNPVETAEKIPAAAAESAVTGAEGFLRNPGRATGGIIGGAAVGAGFGKFAGTTRLGTGRTGRAISAVDVDPGKLAVRGAREVRRFARDERGQVSAGRTRSRGGSGSDIEGDSKPVISAEELKGFEERLSSEVGFEKHNQPRLNQRRNRPSGRPSGRYRQDTFPDRETPPADDLRRVDAMEKLISDPAAGAGRGSIGSVVSGASAGVLTSVSAGGLTGATIPSTFDEGAGPNTREEMFAKSDVDVDAVGAGEVGGTLLNTDLLAQTMVDTDVTPDVGTRPRSMTNATPDVDSTQDTGITPDVDATPDQAVTPDERLTPDRVLTPERRITPDPDPNPVVLDPDPDPDPEPELELLSDPTSERRRRRQFALFSKEIENPVTDPGAIIAGEADLFEGEDF